MNIADVSPILNDFYAAKAHADALIHAVDGFAIAPWIKRYGSGHCTHNGYFHINNGWDYSRQTIVPGHFRTNNFDTVEQAIEPIDMLPVTFGELASFNGKLWRTNGFWDYPQHPGNDHTTSNVYFSDTGGLWNLDSSVPPVDRECAMALAHTDGFLYIGMGERYTINPPPTYQMPTDIWRRGPTGWTQQNNGMHARRSFAYFSWDSSIVVGCGRDDTNYVSVTDLNDFIASTDGGVTFQPLGNGPFRGAYGRRATAFNGGIVLTGGACTSQAGSGTTANTGYLDEVWFSATPLDPTSWVVKPPLPIALVHHMAGVLPIDGVPTMAIIGGYNSNARPDGSPYGTIYTTTDLITWTARHDSGFWVDP